MARLTAGEFYFSPGSRFPAELAPQVGKELLALETDLGREVKPHDVLSYARSHKKSAIGKCFDWDEKAAAEAHWRRTAGDLCRAIQVHILIEEPKGPKSRDVVIDSRLFYRVEPLRPNPEIEFKAYHNAMEALSNVQYRSQILEEKLRELDRWRRINAHFQELHVFFQAIDKANEDFGRKPAA